jgi:hypothetical protein
MLLLLRLLFALPTNPNPFAALLAVLDTALRRLLLPLRLTLRCKLLLLALMRL